MSQDSELSNPSASLDVPAKYLIHVGGWLDPNWFEYHQDLSINVSAGPNQATESTLSGPVAEQSELIGILSTLHHFGLVLLLVRKVEPETASFAADTITDIGGINE